VGDFAGRGVFGIGRRRRDGNTEFTEGGTQRAQRKEKEAGIKRRKEEKKDRGVRS